MMGSADPSATMSWASATWSSRVRICEKATPERQQVDEVGPDPLPRRAFELGAEGERVGAVPVQHFTAIDVADPGQHRLIHQQLGNRSAAQANSIPSALRVCGWIEGVGPESRLDRS